MEAIILGRKAIKEDLLEIVNLYENVCDGFIGKENYCGIDTLNCALRTLLVT